MKGRLTNAATEYEKKFANKKGKEASFYPSEMIELIQANYSDSKTDIENVLNICYAALTAGYMVGYRKGKATR